jgi:hypothetical protein
MTKLGLFGATLILLTGMATPVFAQAAISEPGAYAFYHPNGDLGIGSSRPVPDAMAMAAPDEGGRMARRGMRMTHHRVAIKRSDRYDMR